MLRQTFASLADFYDKHIQLAESRFILAKNEYGKNDLRM